MDLTEQFISGLFSYGLTYKQFIERGYRYAGGDDGSHWKYFRLLFGSKHEFPTHKDNCVCGHEIRYNCYITYDGFDEIMVLGSCCIKRFMPKETAGRTCSNCKKPHKNSKDNYCHECRELLPKCRTCEKTVQSDKIYCSECEVNCKYCKIITRDRSDICFDCIMERKKCEICNEPNRNYNSGHCQKCMIKCDQCHLLSKEKDEQKCSNCLNLDGQVSCSDCLKYFRKNSQYTDKCHLCIYKGKICTKCSSKNERIEAICDNCWIMDHTVECKECSSKFVSESGDICNDCIKHKCKKCSGYVEPPYTECYKCSKNLWNTDQKCKKCKAVCDKKYDLCTKCKFETVKHSGKCLDCKKKIGESYQRCFNCNKKHKDNL